VVGASCRDDACSELVVKVGGGWCWNDRGSRTCKGPLQGLEDASGALYHALWTAR
jgi:hypothetical protein